MDYSTQDNDTVIDLSRLLKTIIRKWRFIIIFSIISAIIITLPMLYGLFKDMTGNEDVDKDPTGEWENEVSYYESSTLMEIKLMEENNEQALAIVELVRSNTVLKKVIDSFKLEMTIEDLREHISVSGGLRYTTVTLTIKALNEDADLAREIADAIRDHGKMFINNSMQIDSFKIIQQANLPNEPLSPEEVQNIIGVDNEEEDETDNETLKDMAKNILKRIVLGGALGIFLSLFILFIQFVLNDKIQTTDDVERYLGKRVLAVVPMYEKHKID